MPAQRHVGDERMRSTAFLPPPFPQPCLVANLCCFKEVRKGPAYVAEQEVSSEAEFGKGEAGAFWSPQCRLQILTQCVQLLESSQKSQWTASKRKAVLVCKEPSRMVEQRGGTPGPPE